MMLSWWTRSKYFLHSKSDQVVVCPHDIPPFFRIRNVFSNFISLLWNYAAQHNSTWLQTSWNMKRHAAASVNMCAGVYLHLRELCWTEHLSIHILWQSTSWESVSPVFSTQPNQRCASSTCNSTLLYSGLFWIIYLHNFDFYTLLFSFSLILLSLRTLP